MALEPLLIVPDLHAPYHDKRGWSILLKAARFIRPKTIVTIGDFADFYTVSTHSKNPDRALGIDGELAVCNAMLDQLDSLGAKRRIFLGGNHEDRLERYLRDTAPKLHPLISIEKVFKLEERGWEYVPYKQATRVGKVYFTHDAGFAGKYSTFQTLATFQHSIVFGHSHRMHYCVEGDATGQMQVGAQFGWLGDVDAADYMHQVKARRDWALGFGIGYHDTTNGLVYLTPVPIVDYSVCVNGRIFRD